MRPKKKKSFHEQIPWKLKATKPFYWRYWLFHRPSGNGFLTILISLMFMGFYVVTLRPNNSIEQLNDSLKKNMALEQKKISFQCHQTQPKNVVTTTRNLSSECPATENHIVLKTYLFLLFIIALSYWIPLMKTQRNIVGKENYLRLKYWVFVLSVLLGFWFPFRIDPALGILVTIMCRFYLKSFLPEEQPHFLEGRESMPYAQAKALSKISAKPEEKTFIFGGIEITESDLKKSCLLLGRAGSGKSITIALLMQKVIPDITSGSGQRAIINDHNLSMLPEIYGMGVNAPVYPLNPLDARGYSWFLAKDFKEPDELWQMSGIFSQIHDKNNKDFFPIAARLCFFSIAYLFSQTAPEKWELRDVLLALFSRQYLFALLGNCPLPNVRKAIEVLGGGDSSKGGSEKQAAGVIGTILTLYSPYSTIAALSDFHARAGRKISLKEWSQDSSILVLGNSNTASESMNVLNQCLIHRACEIILDMPESKVASNWLFLDEFVGLGYQQKIPKLALEGRKRGVCMVLGIQSVADVIHLYGREKAESLLGQIENKAILSVSDRISAEWAAQIIGSQTTWDGDSVKSIKTLDVVPPSEFIDIPVINPRLEIGLKGFYSTKVVHTYTYPFSYIKKTLKPADESVPNFIPAPAKYKHLRPWDDEDIERLGIGELLQGKSSEKPIDYNKINDFFNRKNPESDMTDISDLSA